MKTDKPSKSEEFYEKAWDYRCGVMKRMLEEGETHPLRLIKKFQSHERFHRVGLEHSTGEMVEIERDNKNLPEIKNLRIQGDQILKDACIYLPSKLPIAHTKPFISKNLEVPRYWQDNIQDFLVDYLTGRNFDAIVELGSGYGKNLIELFYNGGPKIPYYGGEYTESGSRTCQMLGDLDPNFDLRAFRFNHRIPDLSSVEKYERVFFFTCHSIEQVDEIPIDLFKTIANHAKEVTCIHFEPFGYQVFFNQEISEVDRGHQDFFLKNNWNRNMFVTMIQAAQENLINIEYVEKNIMGGHKHVPTSIALWKNNNR